jgi:multiple sugar transport system substrate-binding protein
VVTLGLPNDKSGRPIPSPLGVSDAFIPKGAKSVEAAKDFVKYVIQPARRG